MELGITLSVVVAILVLALVFLYLSVRVVQQYEKMVVFRLGRTNERLVRDPGLRFLIPIVDRPVKVDVREQFIEVASQTTITRDNAPINVDFLIYWRIADPLKSIVNVAYFAGALQGVATTTLVEHDSKIDLLLAPPTPEMAELVTKEHLTQIIDVLRGVYDYVVVDVDKRLDDMNLGLFDTAEHLYVVLTADLSCLKNVRLVLETLGHIGYEADRVKLILNRSNAFTGINAKTAEGALRHPIDLQVLNEYRGAISALNSGAPVMFTKSDSPLGRSFHDLALAIDRGGTPGTASAAVPAR